MSLADLLRALPIPIIQAPMVGASNEALALAVCGAGGMGMLAAGALSAAEIGPAIGAMRAATDQAFGVNLLMAPAVAADPAEVRLALQRLAPWCAQLGVALPDVPNQFAPSFSAQFEALAAATPCVATFTFSVLTAAQVSRLQAAGTLVVGTATAVAEARAWANVGADGA